MEKLTPHTIPQAGHSFRRDGVQNPSKGLSVSSHYSPLDPKSRSVHPTKAPRLASHGSYKRALLPRTREGFLSAKEKKQNTWLALRQDLM